MATIDVRAAGRRRKLMDDFSVPIPPPDPGAPRLLRHLIEQVVRLEVAAFRDRQQANRFLRALSAAEIEAAAERGKVDSGGTDLEPQTVDDEEAVAVALEAFADGVYFVVIDGEQATDLDAEVHVQDDSRITFLRLTMLAGG